MAAAQGEVYGTSSDHDALGMGEESKEQRGTTNASMKAAAELIQTLDLAYSEMTSCAADAAKDAETARRNARAASEIARRYITRSYPAVQSTFGISTTTSTRAHGSSNGGTYNDRANVSTSLVHSPGRMNMSVDKEEEDLETKDGEESVLSSTGVGTGMDPLAAINGLATKLQTPRAYPEPTKNTFTGPPPSRSKPRNYQTPTSADRIAQSHAEDVLTLSMELERTKQALKSEHRMHEDTKASMSSHQAKTGSLEEQNQKLLEQIEELKKARDQQVSVLEQELARANHLVQAAEEDAQLALDLAKESAEKRDEMEDDLEKALAEVTALKEQTLQQQQQLETQQTNSAFETPRRTVHFSDDSPSSNMDFATPRMTPTPSRSMVAAGRQLLRRSHVGSSNDEVITLEMTPAKSAERRRRLRERLTKLEEEPPIANLVVGSATPLRSPARGGGTADSEACQSAAKMIQESGRRLDLAGHWWRKGINHGLILEMEAMTRQYCQSVEFKIERQDKEINELGSLCNFLEKRLVTGDNKEYQQS